MSASRLKSLGKLVILIGLPVAVVVGLFGAGVLVGYDNRAAVLRFERDWLGFDVVVPGEPEAKPAEVKPAEPKPAETKPSETKPAETKSPEPTPRPTPETTTPTPTPETTPPVLRETPGPAEALPIAVAEPEPLPPEAQARLSERVKVRVKLIVDAELFDRRADWIDYAERHVRWASEVLSRQLGVELELRGVVAWPAAWPNGQAALAEVQTIDRDGADLVVGLGGRNLRTPVQAAPASTQAHASAAIAFADSTPAAPHLRGLLRAITHAMGGDPVIADSAPLAFSAADRRIILDRKHLPFAPVAEEAPPEPPADDVAPEGDN